MYSGFVLRLIFGPIVFLVQVHSRSCGYAVVTEWIRVDREPHAGAEFNGIAYKVNELVRHCQVIIKANEIKRVVIMLSDYEVVIDTQFKPSSAQLLTNAISPMQSDASIAVGAMDSLSDIVAVVC